MNRPPTTSEAAVLTVLSSKIQAIVQAGTQNRLEATGVLGDPNANQADYVQFQQRNRAWLRSTDYDGFAQTQIMGLWWQQTLAAWQQLPDMAGMLSVESALRSQHQVIGDRYGWFWKLNLTNAGGPIADNPATKELSVGRQRAGGSSLLLADLIVSALIDAIDYDDASDPRTQQLTTDKHRIVDLLCAHHRSYEQPYLTQIRQGAQGAQAAVPTQADWDALHPASCVHPALHAVAAPCGRRAPLVVPLS